MCTRARSVLSKEAPCGAVLYSRPRRRLTNLVADAGGGSSVRGPADRSHSLHRQLWKSVSQGCSGRPRVGAGQGRQIPSGAALTAFLIAELADDSDVGGADEERFARAAGRIEYAIESLQHVATQLHARVHSASSLPLPFDPPVDARVPSARLGAVGLTA